MLIYCNIISKIGALNINGNSEPHVWMKYRSISSKLIFDNPLFGFVCSRKGPAYIMAAYFCREIRDSYHDNFRKLSRKFEVSRKFYLNCKKFSKKYITIKLLSRKFYVDYFSFVHETDIEVKIIAIVLPGSRYLLIENCHLDELGRFGCTKWQR